jgi:hypothetical protein
MSHSLITSALLTVLTNLATARQPKGLVPASASAARASRRPASTWTSPRRPSGHDRHRDRARTVPSGPRAGDGDRDPATRILCSLSRFCWRPCYPGVHGLHRPGSASPGGKPDEPLAWLTRASRNTRASPSQVPGSARTVTMPHRGGPDRINVTSLRFVGADRGCCCDESRGWGLICSWASMAIRVWRTGNPGEPRLRSTERTRGTPHLPRARCRPMAATRSQLAVYVPLWK